MRKILFLIISFLVCSCSDYDSYESMKEQSVYLDGMFGFKIGESITDVMQHCKSNGYTIEKGVPFGILTYNDNIEVDEECMDSIRWFTVSNVSIDSIRPKDEIALTFYDDKLIFIETSLGHRDILNESLKGDYLEVSDNVSKSIKSKYGKGIDLKKSNKVSKKYNTYPNFYPDKSILRYYDNENVFLVTEYYDWSKADLLSSNEKTMHVICGACNSEMIKHIKKVERTYNHRRKPTMDDEEYKKSVSRQKYLEDMEMDDAAELERKARIRYLEGGGYHSKDGGSQVHFKGSKEQEEQLKQMDEMGW